MKTLINIGKSENEDRRITIQYLDDKFYIAHEGLKTGDEALFEYSFDAYVATMNLMKEFITELCLNDKQALLKLREAKIADYKMKTIFKYV